MVKVSKEIQNSRRDGLESQRITAARVLRGQYFSGVHEIDALDDDASIEVLVATTTLASIRVLLSIGGSIGGDATARMFENVVTSDDGVVVPMVDRNRRLMGSPLTQVFHTPVVTDPGVLLFGPLFIPGGTGNMSSKGGELTDVNAWLLAPGVKYLIRLTNLSGFDQSAEIVLNMVESPFI